MKLDPRRLSIVLVSSLVAAAASAQEQEKPRLPDIGAPAGGGGREEMIKLFHRVERRLGEIDRLLYDASTGQAPLESQKESGIGDLIKSATPTGGVGAMIKSSSSKSQEAIRDIDKILEIAAANGGSCSGAMGGNKPSQGQPKDGNGQPQPGDGQAKGSPLDQQQGKPSDREQTPEKPGDKGQPKDGGKKPEPSDQNNGQPQSPADSKANPENLKTGAPPPIPTAKTDAAQSNERWGDLPVQVRDLFRTEGGGDMPSQYRDWIDAYYRRLNQRP